MIPNVVRGGRMTGLMLYLAGPGRANEHENPHLVAGDDTVLAAVQTGKELGREDAIMLADTLDQPRKVYGREVTVPVRRVDPETGRKVKVGEKAGHVWHCSLSLNAEVEGPLSDAAWRLIAEQFVERMGFVDPDGAKSSRWAAVRHGFSKSGNDHIHIAVQMVTEDGSRARTHHDYARAQKVCRELEREHGLAITEGAAVGQVLPHEKAHERERAQRENSPVIERRELRRRLRAAAAGATSEAQFVQRVFSAGVIIRPRFAKGGTNRVSGYSVALPPPAGVDREPVFYSPAKHLDRNLSLPKVRASLGVPAEGDPEAVGVWQEHHTATREPGPMKHPGPPAEALRNRLAAGAVDANDLARIYAIAAIHYEKDRPGPLSEASEQLASVAVNPIQAGYMARLSQRATSPDALEGWKALAWQAVRLSHVMAKARFGDTRERMSASHVRVLTDASKAHDLIPAGAKSAVTKTAKPGRQLTERERIFGVTGRSTVTPKPPTHRDRTTHRPGGQDHGLER